MYSCLRLLFFITLIFGSQTTLVFADRIKDLTSLAGIRSNQLVGYGVVVGLAGSGDGILALHCSQCSHLFLGLVLLQIWMVSMGTTLPQL